MTLTSEGEIIYTKSKLVEMNTELLKSLSQNIQNIIDRNDFFIYEKSAYKDFVNIQNEMQAQININRRKK